MDRFERWLRGRSPLHPAMESSETALRAAMLREVLAAGAALCAVYAGLGWSGIVRGVFFPWDAVEFAAGIAIAAALAARGHVANAAVFFVAIASHPASFLIATYGIHSPAPVLLALTIPVAGMMAGRKLLPGWFGVCCASLLFVDLMPSGWNRSHLRDLSLWFAVYGAFSWLVMLFSKHLEALLRANRSVEEAERSAIVGERTRIAREMHDTLAQGFAGVVIQVNAAEEALRRDPGGAQKHLDAARSLARASLTDARRAMTALRPEALEKGDLLSAIRGTCETLLAGTSLLLEGRTQGAAFSLPLVTEANLLRIAQESVANALRHARATRVAIRLAYQERTVVLEVTDDGVGLSPKGADGLGMRGMKERAAEIGAGIEFLGAPGSGTTVRVTAPAGGAA